MDREPFMETKSVLRAYRTRKAITKNIIIKIRVNSPDRKNYVLLSRGNYAQFAAGMTSLKDKSFNSYKIEIKLINFKTPAERINTGTFNNGI